MRPTALLLVLAAAAGCNDLATPAELARPQILAVRADPPAIPAGSSSELSILIAGPEGTIDDATLSWTVAEPTPELPAIGAIEIDGDERVWYVAPSEVGSPSVATVEVSAQVDSESALVALKGIGVGVNNATENPNVDDLVIDGQSFADGDAVTVQRDQVVSLDAVVSPPPTNNAIISWYATLGEIELYRRAPTELIAPAETGEGWLYIVYRDARGGVAWRHVALTVE
jgi:hypothetical protein